MASAVRPFSFMAMVISIHEYVLRSGVDPADFERAIQAARESGLLRLPGLVDYYFLKGIRGSRKNGYTAVWVYQSKETWEALWGPVGQPISRQAYRDNWRIWEDEILSKFLDRDPNAITYTAYETI